MELWIGGYAQGKLELVQQRYPKARVADEFNFRALLQAESKTGETVIWNHFHLCARALLEEGRTTEEVRDLAAGVQERYPELVIISDEIGNGIVPMEAFERLYREETGRLLIQIAAEARQVWRVSCGLAQRIK